MKYIKGFFMYVCFPYITVFWMWAKNRWNFQARVAFTVWAAVALVAAIGGVVNQSTPGAPAGKLATVGNQSASNGDGNTVGTPATKPLDFIDKDLSLSGKPVVPKYAIKTLSTSNNVWDIDAQTKQSITKGQAVAIANKVLHQYWKKYDGIMITVEEVKDTKVNGQTVETYPIAYSWKEARNSQGAQVEGMWNAKLIPFVKEIN